MPANRFDTLVLHAGAAPDPTTGARATPIYQTTSFSFRDTDHAASLFNMERSGHVYSRISNPTVAVFEERVAALEGGVGAIGTASGQAALHLAIATLMGAGSHVVASSALYGGSHNLLHYTMRRFGIDTTFVPPHDPDAWRAAIRPNTRLLFGETLGNPGLDVLDIETIADIAHSNHVPLLVDSTFTTPYLLRPLTMAPTSSTTRRPSSWAATVRRLAACWWTAARSTSQLPISSPSSPNPTMDFTAWSSPKKALLHRSCCAPVARGCATSEPACIRKPHGNSCRASKPCRCGWTGTSPTPARWSNSCSLTLPWKAWLTRNSTAIATTRSPNACCRAARAPCSASTCVAT